MDEEEEIRAAAREAGRIGGHPGRRNPDPAQQPLEEAGEGESEGWELAEEELILHATHSDDRSDTIVLEAQGRLEAEPDPAQHGEADQVPGGA